MGEELKATGYPIDENGKKFIMVKMSFKALSQLNKIILGDNVDKDDEKAVELREQVHKDCLEIMRRIKQ